MIIGTVAMGTKAPSRMSAPPTSSTMIVAQPSKSAKGMPIACSTLMKASAPRASFA